MNVERLRQRIADGEITSRNLMRTVACGCGVFDEVMCATTTEEAVAVLAAASGPVILSAADQAIMDRLQDAVDRGQRVPPSQLRTMAMKIGKQAEVEATTSQQDAVAILLNAIVR